jgi:hypothetical protein
MQEPFLRPIDNEESRSGDTAVAAHNEKVVSI